MRQRQQGTVPWSSKAVKASWTHQQRYTRTASWIQGQVEYLVLQAVWRIFFLYAWIALRKTVNVLNIIGSRKQGNLSPTVKTIWTSEIFYNHYPWSKSILLNSAIPKWWSDLLKIMGLKNGNAVRKTSLNPEVMEVGIASVEVLLSNLREGRRAGAVQVPAALITIWVSFWDQIFSTINSFTSGKKKSK